jgi:hypothetical protein
MSEPTWIVIVKRSPSFVEQWRWEATIRDEQGGMVAAKFGVSGYSSIAEARYGAATNLLQRGITQAELIIQRDHPLSSLKEPLRSQQKRTQTRKDGCVEGRQRLKGF